ncbi:unnamed protein product [Albugo candida]|uniref:Uncharacterized protein n=1 Tax=Albugo candida TaxID=65357 RepID=A0A024FSX9_9STRA|nr:unnamed protein product [Albugo candida]|eukprot:CCI10051.1 unnamed protein product [Albugo candida]
MTHFVLANIYVRSWLLQIKVFSSQSPEHRLFSASTYHQDMFHLRSVIEHHDLGSEIIVEIESGYFGRNGVSFDANLSGRAKRYYQLQLLRISFLYWLVHELNGSDVS